MSTCWSNTCIHCITVPSDFWYLQRKNVFFEALKNDVIMLSLWLEHVNCAYKNGGLVTLFMYCAYTGSNKSSTDLQFYGVKWGYFDNTYKTLKVLLCPFPPDKFSSLLRALKWGTEWSFISRGIRVTRCQSQKFQKQTRFIK